MMHQERVRSEIKIMFSDPLITATFHYEYDDDKNNTDTFITNTTFRIPKLEPVDEGLDSVQLEGGNVQAYVANEDPNVSGIEITNSLIMSVDDIKSENIPDQNSSEYVSEDNYFTDTVTNYVVTTNMEDNKDWLKSHVQNEMSNNEEINQYPGIANANSFQNQYQVDNLKIEENGSEIIYSHQVGNGHNEIKNYQSEPEISDVDSQQQDVCNVAQYKNSTDLEEDNQGMNIMNTINKTVYLNESDNSMYSYIVTVEPPKAIESSKRKRTISNSDVKKQRLNETNSSYDNSSIIDNTTSSINITHPSTNASSILNMSSNCGNKHLLNSDLNNVLDLPSNVDEESIKPQSVSINTNVLSALINQAFSWEPNYVSPLQFEQTSKKVTDFYNKEKSSKNVLLDKDISDSESLSETIILSDSEIIAPNTDILSDHEVFSDTETEFSSNTPESNVIETDCIIVTDKLNLDSDDEIVDFEIKPDQKIDTDCQFVPDCKKSSGDIILSNNKNLLDITTTNRLNNLKEINWTIVDNIKKSERLIESHGEVELLSDDEESQPIILSDNEENIIDCMIISDDEIEQSSGDEESQSMVISDNENNIIDSIVISYDEIKLPSANKESQCMIISDNEEEFNNIKISMSGSNNIVNSQALKPLSINNSRNKSGFFEFPCLELNGNHSFNDVLSDDLQSYFEEICEAIRFYINDAEDQSLKMLYSEIGNETDMLLYLMENLRMLYNEELILSDTACPSAQNYYIEQMETLYNHYGDPKYNINASKPFIHPSSRLHQYSKRISSTFEPLKITDITSTSTSVQNSSNVSYTATDISVSQIENRCTTYKAKQSFPLFNPLSNSKNIVPANIVSRYSKTRTTCTKPILSNIIPYSTKNRSTLTPSVPHQTQIKVQLPFVVQKRKRDNTKVYYCPKILAPPPPAIPIPNAMRSSIVQTKPPVLLQKNQHSINY